MDTYGCQLMGLSLEDVPYIRLAEAWGAGSTRLRSEDIVSLNAPDAGNIYPEPSGLVKKLTRNVHADKACSACFASLVRALYQLKESGIDISEDIYIGQGWRKQSLPGMGCGNCCHDFASAIPGCPPSSSDIIAALYAHR